MNYYFYFDEGGMFGTPELKISETELKSKDLSEDTVEDYFFGYLPIESIKRHVELFQKAFPGWDIIMDEESKSLLDINLDSFVLKRSNNMKKVIKSAFNCLVYIGFVCMNVSLVFITFELIDIPNMFHDLISRIVAYVGVITTLSIEQYFSWLLIKKLTKWQP